MWSSLYKPATSHLALLKSGWQHLLPVLLIGHRHICGLDVLVLFVVKDFGSLGVFPLCDSEQINCTCENLLYILAIIYLESFIHEIQKLIFYLHVFKETVVGKLNHWMLLSVIRLQPLYSTAHYTRNWAVQKKKNGECQLACDFSSGFLIVLLAPPSHLLVFTEWIISGFSKNPVSLSTACTQLNTLTYAWFQKTG